MGGPAVKPLLFFGRGGVETRRKVSFFQGGFPRASRHTQLVMCSEIPDMSPTIGDIGSGNWGQFVITVGHDFNFSSYMHFL